MPKVINYTNILQPLEREVKYTFAKNKQEILSELQYDVIAYDLIIVKNGIVTTEDFEVIEGDVICVQIVPRGGGGGLLKMVAMVALAVAAPYIASYIAGAIGVSGVVATAMITGGIMVAGGMLINALLPASVPSFSMDNNALSTSNTYSWNQSNNESTNGTILPKVFGTHKVTPPLIGKYIESIDDKQYINMLYAVNDGQITNLTDITINDESIDNFDNVSIDIRYGTNNQLVIPAFNDSRFDKSVGQKLSTDFDTTTTNRSDVTEITAVIYFPKGLYYMNDKGNLENTSVKIVVEYSSNGINWTPMDSQTTITAYNYYYEFAYDAIRDGYYKYNSSGTFIETLNKLESGAIALQNGTNTPIGKATKSNKIYALPYTYTEPYEIITKGQTEAFRKTFTRKYLTAGQYQVRARLYEEPINSTRYGNDVYFEYIEECVSDDFSYPSTALLAVRALATDQLSGSMPKISCTVTANSNNPALICKQLLIDSGESLSNIDTQTFSEWETECNTQNYTCNIVFDSEMTLRGALDIVSLLGRASIQQFGSKYAVIMDKKNILPVQSFTFGMGNILTDTFKQTYLPLSDRSNVIEVSYYDASKDYERAVFEVSNANYDNVVDRKVSTLNLVGCTSKNMAMKHAQYQLNCNRYLSETIEFEAFQDSLVCKYGDIIGVSHDVPQYGYSGRIVSKVGNVVTLDRNVVFEAGKSYGIILRNANNQIEEINVTGTGETNVVTLSTASAYTYTNLDNYSFGEVNKINKLYRIIKIATGSELTRTIYALEYNADVYNDDITIDIPSISDLGLKSLFISDYIRYKANSNEIEVVANLKWTGISISYQVSYKKESEAVYTVINTNDTCLDIAGLQSGVNYNFIVKDSLGKTLSKTYYVLGKFAKPNDITYLNGYESGNTFVLSWSHTNRDIDFKTYEIYLNNKYIGSTIENNYSYFSSGLDLKTFTVKTVDTSNLKSDGISKSITAQPPKDVTNFKVDNAFSTRKILSWDYNKEDDFKSFEIRIATGSIDSWNNATSIHKGEIPQSPFAWDYAGYKQYTLFIKALDSGGNYSINADRILFNVGDMSLDNILTTVSQQPTWSGDLTNGSVAGGKLLTLSDNTSLYAQTKKYGKSSFYDGGLLYIQNNFYSGVSSNFLYGRKVPILDYIFYTTFPAGGNVKFTYDITGDFTLKYVKVGGNSFYTTNEANKYNGGNLYSDYTNYTEYNKPFAVENGTVIKWQLKSTGGGMVATSFNAICDVEDKYDLLNDKVIPIGGIQIPPTKSFYQIQNVLVTLQGAGIPRVTSKNPTGATIQIFSTSGTDIGGVADIQYKGY